MKLIKLSNINQIYAQGKTVIKVFNNLNLDINNQSNVGIIGPSGSGKSSLLNILGLVEKPKSGDYFFNGQECSTLNVEDRTSLRKKDVGFIFQNNQLLEDFTVLGGPDFKYLPFLIKSLFLMFLNNLYLKVLR